MVYKSGAIILNNKNLNLVLLLFRGKEQDYTFPKGHVESSEDIESAMRREVSEETGLSNLLYIQELPDLVYKHPEKGDILTKMFAVIADGNESLVLEKTADKLEWVPMEKVVEKLSYNNLREYYNKNISILIHIKNHTHDS